MVKTGVLTSLLVAGAATAVLAQQPSRQPDAEMIRSRQKISLVEGTLERAVLNGAANFARRVQAVAPAADGTALLLGSPVVRGFTIEGKGIFFDVQMPSVQLSMVWPLRYSQQSDASRLGIAGPVTAAVQAQTPASIAPPLSAADAALLDDPAEAWRTEVRATLIDAMIENTGSVTVKPEDAVIVAARAMMSSDRMPDPGETRTIELTLKGSDLQAFRNQTITLEEARKRVSTREY